MSIVIRNKAILLDGTTGGTVAVLPDYKSIQIAIAGRLTGVITVTATTLGAEGPEGFAPAFLIDLSKEYTGKIEGYVIESLTFTPDVAGDDFAVTVSQWATN